MKDCELIVFGLLVMLSAGASGFPGTPMIMPEYVQVYNQSCTQPTSLLVDDIINLNSHHVVLKRNISEIEISIMDDYHKAYGEFILRDAVITQIHDIFEEDGLDIPSDGIIEGCGNDEVIVSTGGESARFYYETCAFHDRGVYTICYTGPCPMVKITVNETNQITQESIEVAGQIIAPGTWIPLTDNPACRLNPPEPTIKLNPNGTCEISWNNNSIADHYNVYLSNVCSAGNVSYSLAAENVTGLLWVDVDAANHQQRYYKVEAVMDAFSNLSTYAVGKLDLQLAPGWSFVSIPLTPTYSGIKPYANSVLSSLHNPSDTDFGSSFNGSYDFIVGPINDESQALASFNPNIPSFLDQNLINITEKVSFQIFMERSDTLTVVGRVPDETQITLSTPGWYWVGYPSCTSRLIKPFTSSALSSMHSGSASDFGPGFDGTYEFVLGPFNGHDSLGTFDPFKPPALPQNLEGMGLGRGYVLYANTGSSFTLDYF